MLLRYSVQENFFVRWIQIISAENHFLERLTLKGNLEIYNINNDLIR